MRSCLLALAFFCIGAPNAFAGLIGSEITASTIHIGAFGIGYTPPTSIIGSGIEMQWQNSGPAFSVLHTADFDDTTLTLRWLQSNSGFGNTTSTFTNSAFQGLSVSVQSTTIPGGLGSFSLVGDKLTVFAVNLNGNPANYEAVLKFDGFAPPQNIAVPEPSSMAVVGLGILCMGWKRRQLWC